LTESVAFRQSFQAATVDRRALGIAPRQRCDPFALNRRSPSSVLVSTIDVILGSLAFLRCIQVLMGEIQDVLLLPRILLLLFSTFFLMSLTGVRPWKFGECGT